MGIIVPGQPAPPFPRPPVVCRPSLPDGSHAPPLPPLPPHGPILHHPPPLPHPPHIPPPRPPMLPPTPHPHIPNLPIPPNNPYSVPPPTEAKSHRPPPPSTQRTDSTMHPPRSTQPRHCPPPLPGTQTTRPPPLPPNSFTVQPPLPPLPPLPPSPKVELSKPPPPNEPPPFIPVKKTREPSASPQSSKVESFTKSSHSTKIGTPSSSKQSGTRRFFSSTPDIEHAKPIPSIVSSRPPAKPAVPHASNGNSRIPCPTVPPSVTPYTIIQASTPPPPPLPPPDTVHPPFPPFMCSPTTFEEEPYDPEEATFSPASSDGSSPLEESAEDTLINKYVRKPSKLRSSENFSSSLKTSERIRCDNKKKKVSFSKDVSFSSKINKSQTDSPARPNLDTRLKIMFGTVEEDASKKARKSLSHALSPNSKSENEVEEQERPLSPTPSPFVSRHMYLYWHKETIKARKASKLSSVDFVNSNTSTLSVKPQLNGQVLMSIPPLKGMPPLPKNLPTVPPPNYKSSLTEPFAIKEGSLKAELILKNINRMHPYKINDSKGYVLKNSLDSELELTSEAMPGESSDEEMSGVRGNDDHENVTVNLVMAKIVEELKQVIREELTKKIVEKRVKVCLDKDKKC
ncbi:uncharacterized protein C6orf132 homolog [Homarus americanus]|uniref:uncharacterized protein C6orf132 homolog n=1 Tax=Homarus americanus TaxID=6706 RepID=UPI001C47E1A1|nr:uncharacterized protein C6orf132 homolog [Homarus americanus]XP_042215844.1 uncharacterized protein C6orf132 homolog [Homarus americanus]XP_042215845.1 uncharacterized protein C6orf132 homolog [Homarus americanus]XP_042215846.1 uncharacterized protein C6orf132 homolog [Homarus americanus]XP_042215847.1 uncharacterized protein C6orf132 homolog [Homarus americanus]XP_042215848.1 uncharacterized protein C6orf132 homolog [Homarus americanus]XP_042215849.1 uncharacterized protein C6orf132 homol